MKLTADTITDEQISDCGLDAEIMEYAIAVDPNWPGGTRWWKQVYREARRQCAKSWDARHAKDGES